MEYVKRINVEKDVFDLRLFEPNTMYMVSYFEEKNPLQKITKYGFLNLETTQTLLIFENPKALIDNKFSISIEDVMSGKINDLSITSIFEYEFKLNILRKYINKFINEISDNIISAGDLYNDLYYDEKNAETIIISIDADYYNDTTANPILYIKSSKCNRSIILYKNEFRIDDIDNEFDNSDELLIDLIYHEINDRFDYDLGDYYFKIDNKDNMEEYDNE